MVLAFGAMEPLSVAAAALSRGVLVAAAGVVVVLAILLVFVMVLRGAGSSRQKSSGLDYDAQEGPVGQPKAPASRQPAGQAPWGGPQANDGFDAMDQNFGQMRPGQQQAQGWGAPFADQAAMPSQPANQWGAPPQPANRWDDPMAPANGSGGLGAGDWGAPQPPAPGQAGMNAWDAPSTGGGNPWDAPAAPQANAWDAPAAPQANAWDAPQPGAPSQPANQWGAQQPMPSQPANQWGAPAQPAAPSQPAWGAQQPMPSQPANAWGAPQAAAPSQPANQWGTQPAAQPGWGGAPAAAPRLVERKADGSGREFDLRKERLTIGRHRESDVFLEDLAVSRLHTTISHDASGRYILRDENSANGTYVNGQRVNEHLLQDGDEVQVGQSVLVFTQR